MKIKFDELLSKIDNVLQKVEFKFSINVLGDQFFLHWGSAPHQR